MFSLSPSSENIVKNLDDRLTIKVYFSDLDDLDKAETVILGPGENFHVYRGLRHRMEALEDTELFEFSTQHFDSDSYRIQKGD